MQIFWSALHTPTFLSSNNEWKEIIVRPQRPDNDLAHFLRWEDNDTYQSALSPVVFPETEAVKQPSSSLSSCRPLSEQGWAFFQLSDERLASLVQKWRSQAKESNPFEGSASRVSKIASSRSASLVGAPRAIRNKAILPHRNSSVTLPLFEPQEAIAPVTPSKKKARSATPIQQEPVNNTTSNAPKAKSSNVVKRRVVTEATIKRRIQKQRFADKYGFPTYSAYELARRKEKMQRESQSKASAEAL